MVSADLVQVPNTLLLHSLLFVVAYSVSISDLHPGESSDIFAIPSRCFEGCEFHTDISRQIFNAIFGWHNTATLGSVLSYVFYWIVIMVVLVYLKWSEGRLSFFGYKSAAGKRREAQSATYIGYEAGENRYEAKAGSEGEAETPSVEKNVPVLNVQQ